MQRFDSQPQLIWDLARVGPQKQLGVRQVLFGAPSSRHGAKRLSRLVRRWILALKTPLETTMKLAWTQQHRLPIVAAAALLTLLGMLAVLRLPLQLLPDIEEPMISLFTAWPGSSALEVERVITEPQERVLRGLPGLVELTANASNGQSWLQMRFEPGTDLDPAFVEVIGRLQRLPSLPRDVRPPQVQRGGGASNTLIYYFVQLLPGSPGPIERYQQAVDREVLQRLQQVPGVASGQLNNGPDRELRIQLDLAKAAELGVQLPDLVDRLTRLDDVSAGAIDVGRTSYTLRVRARLEPNDLEALPVARIGERVVLLSEMATAEFVRPDRTALSFQNGNPALTIQLFREPGTNVLETLNALDEKVAEIERDYLNKAGLAMRKSFEPGIFIRRALTFLGGNLGLGLFAAIALLWWFLRDARATLLIALAVPISLSATVLALAGLGRNLNMISIAGLAFAVGMVMDAAIVVVESVLAERARGAGLMASAVQGANKVAGALFASTLTTVAVFLPVLGLRGIEGQVFADLALTLSISVLVSLAVALWVVPALIPLMKLKPERKVQQNRWDWLAAVLSRRGTGARSVVLISSALIVLPVLLSVLLAPKRDFLPPVKRAAVDSFLRMPPGMGTDQIEREVVQPIMERLRPYMEGKLEPKLLNYYVLTWPNGGTLGARVVDPSRIGELEQLLNDKVLKGLPDAAGFAREGELFGGIGGGGRAIWIHLRGGDVDALRSVAMQAEADVQKVLPGAITNIEPGANADAAELAIEPNDLRLSELGLSRAWLGSAVQILGDGRFISEHFDGDRSVPIILRGSGSPDLDSLAQTPLATPSGTVLLGEIAQLSLKRAPADLRRVNFARAVTLSVSPSDSVALETALEAIRRQVLPKINASLPSGASIEVGGSAGRLDQITESLLGNLALALLGLSVLLLLVLRSAYDAAVVLATLPIAGLGGVLGLRVLGLFVPQSLDLLTMIGFVMLLAMVVANAVLLVSETRAGQAQGLNLNAAIEQALGARLRALTLGALTGVLGALPLAVSPGPGAAIYRGLSAVTCGGVTLSLLLVVVLVPALLRIQVLAMNFLQRFQKRALAPQVVV